MGSARSGKGVQLLLAVLAALFGFSSPDLAQAFATPTGIPSVWNQQARDLALWDGTVWTAFRRNLAAQLPIVGSPDKIDLVNTGLVANCLDRPPPQGKKPLGFIAWLLLHHPQDVPILLHVPNQNQDSPLAARYRSQVPYAFGDRVCRYAVTPDAGSLVAPPTVRNPDYLQAAMIEHLTHQGWPARFDFMVQVRDDARPEVIDDPTVTWDVPPFRIATLTIPPPQFASSSADPRNRST